MSAIGFGQKVTGGEGPNSAVLDVTTGNPAGPESLTVRLEEAKKRSNAGQSTVIVIKKGITVTFEEEPRKIRARNLTITGEQGATIHRRLLELDCEEADNVILRDLIFDGTPSIRQMPTDSVHLDALKGRGPTGFWIDHCLFKAVFDLSFTANTKDVEGAPPLLLTVSGCRFENDDPGGVNRENNGALGVHGFNSDSNESDRDLKTNAYATICDNYFLRTRRRAPRSSNLTFVHAFNNVLEDWGAPESVRGTDPEQSNGMISGNFGLLVAEANYFQAGTAPGSMKEAITVAAGKQPGRLTVPPSVISRRNLYVNGAIEATTVGLALSVSDAYATVHLYPPESRPSAWSSRSS